MEPAASDSKASLASAPARIGHVRWTICAMLFAATSINYVDRQVIAILKPTLEQSIGLTEVQYGYIVDCFQIAYGLGMLVAGRLIDKLGTRIGYMLVMGFWSLSAMAHSLARTAVQFGVARFGLGFGEAGNFPAAIKTVAEWFPQSERSLATGIFNSGSNVGAVLAPLLVPWITLHYGWHAAFLCTGIFSAAWILLWARRYRLPDEHPAVQPAELELIYRDGKIDSEPSMPWSKLWGRRQTWGFALAKFLTDPIWYFYLFWLPSYFSAKFHLNLSHLGLPLIIIYNVSAIGSIGGGWLPALFRSRSRTQGHARLAAMSICACLVVPIALASRVQSEWMAIALISVAAGAHQGWSANLFTTSSDMFPRNAVASVVGIGNMMGSIGSALFAFYAGHVLQFTHSYASLFAIAASNYLLAMLVLTLLAPGLRKAEISA